MGMHSGEHSPLHGESFCFGTLGLEPGQPRYFSRFCRVRSCLEECSLKECSPGAGGLAGIWEFPEGREVLIRITLERMREGIFAVGSLATRATGECSRCLEPVELPLFLAFRELFVYNGVGAEGQEYEYIAGSDCVNIAELCRDLLVLALPFQYWCESECRYPELFQDESFRAGSPRTPRESSGAAQSESFSEKPSDPRWAALEALLESPPPNGSEREAK